ncbi:uncharacterized protein LOC111074407 [Drosophila obscura]|uniref:uncharacterized protein LOC111074407 n=1 Tax=Drosophila obscura TaxID=7282 RepID=UPI001BB0F0AF|nr:uncharacterized protein LOC111074407 [Drosophila obscura]
MQSCQGLSKISLKHLFDFRVEHFKIIKGPNGHHLASKCQEEIKKKLPASSYEDVMAWVGSWITRLNGENTVPPKTALVQQADSVIETRPAKQPATEAAPDQPPPFVIDLCSDEDEPAETCQSLDSLLDSEYIQSKAASLIIHDDELGDINLKDYADHIDGKIDVETLKQRVAKKKIAKRFSQTSIKQYAKKLKFRLKPRVIRPKPTAKEVEITGKIQKGPNGSELKSKQDKNTTGRAPDEPTTEVRTGRVKLKANEDRSIVKGKAQYEPTKTVCTERSNLKSNEVRISITHGKAPEEPTTEERTGRVKLIANEVRSTITIRSKAPDGPSKTVCAERSNLKSNERISITADKVQDTPTIRVRNDLVLNGNVLAPLENTLIVDGPVNQPAKSKDSTSSAGNRKRKECETTTEDGQGMAKRQSIQLTRTNPSVYLQLPTIQLLLDEVAHFSVGQGNSQALMLINQLRHSLQTREQMIWNAANLHNFSLD